MVQLLDLPVEVFRTVIETTVENFGLRDSVKLREVNKVFNDEVMRAFETLLIFRNSINYTCNDFKARHNHEYGAALIPFIARFLERRPHTQPDEFWKTYRAREPSAPGPFEVKYPWQLNISAFLHTLLDELHFPPDNRYEALRILCTAIDVVHVHESDDTGSGFSLPGIVGGVLKAFRPFNTMWLASSILPAAILLRKDEVYNPLLTTDAIKKLPTEYFPFPSVVGAAVMSGQYELVKQIRRLSGNEGEHALWQGLEAAVMTGDLDMVELFLEKQEDSHSEQTDMEAVSDMAHLSLNSSASLQGPPDSNIRDALIRSARLGHTAIAERLLKYIAANRPEFGTEHLAGAMYYAALYGYLDYMQLLVDHGATLLKARSEPEDGPLPIELACWTGNRETVEWILAREPRATGPPTVLTAIISNNIPTLKSLIKTEGASMTSDEWLSIIWYGMRLRGYAAMSYLLEEAKVVDVVAGFKAHPTNYGTLLEASASEGHPEALEILLRVGMPPDTKLCQGNNGINDDWTPMMFAHASTNPGSRKVEEILESLGVKRVNMLEMPGKHLFENGYYPHGSTPLESEMPVKNGVRERDMYWAKLEEDAVVVNYKSPTGR